MQGDIRAEHCWREPELTSFGQTHLTHYSSKNQALSLMFPNIYIYKYLHFGEKRTWALSRDAGVGFSLLFVGIRDLQGSFQGSKTKCHVADAAS